ncbi:hypothetical protein FNV43_RR04846 [Rhamnella rubrinervis]|uniref:Uncharacterized protein n=1 Tax=Rhamnella rubrinervis TaxID=2594499 RepID=A0A8K0MQI5_9ROSA|nr:hypothetical protein FNV43_RR04846 [Rhamnella rubrinervis]
MAKKKVSHQAKDTKQEAPKNPHHNTEASMEDPSEKLQNLKSLNSMLLKETFERRQQIDSLVNAKEALEAELTRSALDKEELEARLTGSAEENFRLELENDVFCAFWESQMNVGFDGLIREKFEIERAKKERETEIGYLKREVSELRGDLENESDKLSRVCRERDVIKGDFDCLFLEANGFREKVVDMEKRESLMKEEFVNLEFRCAGLMEENEEGKRAVEVLMREKDLAERNLVESEKLIETLEKDIEGIVKEKNEIGMEKRGLEVRTGELEKELGQWNGTVMHLCREMEALQLKISELESSIVEGKKDMEMEVKAWLEEKRENEQDIELLKVQMDGIKKVLDRVTRESEDKQRKIEELIQEKNEIDEAKAHKESEIVELHNEISELRDAMFTLGSSFIDLEVKYQSLLSEVSSHKDALDRVTLQKDEKQKDFDEERKKVEDFMLVISRKEKMIEELVEELQKLKIERETLTEKTKVSQSRMELLVKEKDMAKSNLLECQSRIDEWKAKSELAEINLERALTMLQSTAAIVSSQSELDRNGKKEVAINERKLEEEILPYVAELDTIQSAFKSKEKMVEDMKQKLEFLQHSEAEAHKKKSFWTLVSSAITILAAASVAYAAKGR